MVTLILAVLIGVIFTLVAVENSQLIALNFFGSVASFPLYLLLAISFLAGTFIAGIFSLFDWTSTAFDFRKKENSYKNAVRINEDLRKDIQKLNAENVRLKEELSSARTLNSERRNREVKSNVKNFFYKLTHPGSSNPSHINSNL